MYIKKTVLTVLLFAGCLGINGQEERQVVPKTDTVPSKPTNQAEPASKELVNKYDSLTKVHSPKSAAIRSAIVPGLGQIYNKKYWKLPIIYGGLGFCSAIFVYNLKYYKDTKFAYSVKYNMRVNGTDSAKYDQIPPYLKPLSEESLRSYRNDYRRDLDYTALIFVLLWGLNVVDAAVDAHLKPFDVSPDLSLRIKPGYSGMAKTNGISLVMQIGR